MNRSNPDLAVLPFQARLVGASDFLTLHQALSIHRARLEIERSYPGAPHSIGWTIFRRTPRKYIYENEPLFRFERGARRCLRRVYAIRYSLVGDDALTYSHLHL